MNPILPKVSCVNPRGKSEIYHARWVILSKDKIIENGYIEVENNRIKKVSAAKPKGKITDLGQGVIMPCLVNAHLHLELSALENALCYDHGFSAWVQELLEKRESLGEKKLKESADKAAEGLGSLGTGVIGEISTLGITRDLVEKHSLAGVWFQEVLGGGGPDDISKPDLVKEENRSFSMAGHGPHTTAPDLLKTLKSQTTACGLVFSIHLAESAIESEFMDKGTGPWADFLQTRGIDISSWPLGRTTPVRYLDKLGILDTSTLAVHLLRTDAQDLEILADRGVRVCLCPRSNENLHKQLPDIGMMLDHGLEPALGTDSLASCGSLSIFDEMGFIRSRYPDIVPETVFAMATSNGAGALGLDHLFGSLDPGKQSRFLYLDLEETHKNQLLERLTWNEI